VGFSRAFATQALQWTKGQQQQNERHTAYCNDSGTDSGNGSDYEERETRRRFSDAMLKIPHGGIIATLGKQAEAYRSRASKCSARSPDSRSAISGVLRQRLQP